MEYRPHAYQQYTSDYIKDHFIAAIFLTMGLGKTVITLSALKDLLFDSFEIRKALIIAPLRVARDTWREEIEKWSHLNMLKYAIAIGSEKERLQALRTQADIYLINRENIDWLINKSGHPFDYDMVVIDELSSFKSHQSKRFRALMKVRPKVKRMVGLTGTPSSNGLMDLWAEFRLLDLGERLGKFIGQYRESYFKPDQRNGPIVYSYKPLPFAEEAIYKKISDITVSMKSEDYLKMPERIHNKILVHLSDKEKGIYDLLKKDLVVSIKDKEIDAVNAAALSNKLLQMASGAVYDEDKKTIHLHDRKLDALEDLIEGANGKPILIAYWYKSDVKRIKERFDVRELKSSRDFKEWNQGTIPIAVIHPASCGHGLNLQAGGSTLIWFSMTWSLELYEQTNVRLYRQGQNETVVIHHILAKETIDEDVIKALEQKNKIQTALMDAVKARLT